MKLAEYLKTAEGPDADFASSIGVSRQALHRYCSGERTPRPEVMVRIRDATKGAVTADDFLPASPAPAEGAAA